MKMKRLRQISGIDILVFTMGMVACSSYAITNIPPTPIIVSAAMRAGTPLMDITYRVNDPDNAMVSAYPLGFVDGDRSFSKVIRPATFEEGSETNFGMAILANTNHKLVWNVGADWAIDLGQIKFEIICKDSRGMMPFEWHRIPATPHAGEVIISKNSPSDTELLNALFWLYASGDPSLVLVNGTLAGTAASGVFSSVPVASGGSVSPYCNSLHAEENES